MCSCALLCALMFARTRFDLFAKMAGCWIGENYTAEIPEIFGCNAELLKMYMICRCYP